MHFFVIKTHFGGKIGYAKVLSETNGVFLKTLFHNEKPIHL
jgi:hypothetical protein